MNTNRHLPRLAVALAAGCLTFAGAATAAGTPHSGLRDRLHAVPGCSEPARSTAACLVVLRFFDHVDHGRFAAACDLLGARLRYESRGPECANAMSSAYFVGSHSWTLLRARPTEVDVGVLVRLQLPELGHTRPVTWRASVAPEPGSSTLRIVSTRRAW